MEELQNCMEMRYDEGQEFRRWKKHQREKERGYGTRSSERERGIRHCELLESGWVTGKTRSSEKGRLRVTLGACREGEG